MPIRKKWICKMIACSKMSVCMKSVYKMSKNWVFKCKKKSMYKISKNQTSAAQFSRAKKRSNVDLKRSLSHLIYFVNNRPSRLHFAYPSKRLCGALTSTWNVPRPRSVSLNMFKSSYSVLTWSTLISKNLSHDLQHPIMMLYSSSILKFVNHLRSAYPICGVTFKRLI